MFDSLKGMAGLAGLMKDLPRIKSRMEDAKQRLGELTVDAETGGGAVRAKANGHLRIVSIDIDHALFSGLVSETTVEDRALAEDLIAGAVNAALQKARDMAEREMSDAMEELGIPIPPGGLGGLLS